MSALPGTRKRWGHDSSFISRFFINILLILLLLLIGAFIILFALTGTGSPPADPCHDVPGSLPPGDSSIIQEGNDYVYIREDNTGGVIRIDFKQTGTGIYDTFESYVGEEPGVGKMVLAIEDALSQFGTINQNNPKVYYASLGTQKENDIVSCLLFRNGGENIGNTSHPMIRLK